MKELTAASLPEIKRVAVDSETLSKLTRDDDFTELAVNLMIETASWVCVAACTMGTTPAWDRDRAAICGNMVRLYKLLHSVLDQTCQRRQETSFILCRLVFETLVNIRYLIENFSPELIESYIAYSFRHERKLREVVLTNIRNRNGEELPIENRMLKSINRAARAAGINLDEPVVREKGSWGGKNLFEKSEAVGLDRAYLAAFGGTSHSVHGNWHEIYGNHLEWDEQNNNFTPNLDWHRPRPQVLFAMSTLVIGTLKKYFAFMCGPQAKLFDASLTDLDDRVIHATNAHENYLTTKTWPEV